jgi:glycosyltransferase involved in cell wall biosynthesis
LAEGFGMPPLEAMASGVPVIAANNTALTEVVGDAGALVESTDVAALRNAMLALATNAQLRIELADKGQKQAEMFSWDEAARRVAAQYRAIAAKDKAP